MLIINWIWIFDIQLAYSNKEYPHVSFGDDVNLQPRVRNLIRISTEIKIKSYM